MKVSIKVNRNFTNKTNYNPTYCEVLKNQNKHLGQKIIIHGYTLAAIQYNRSKYFLGNKVFVNYNTIENKDYF